MTWGALFRRLWFLLRAEWYHRTRRLRVIRRAKRIRKLRLQCESIARLARLGTPLAERFAAAQVGELVEVTDQEYRTILELQKAFYDRHGPLLTGARRSARAGAEMVRQGLQDPRVTELATYKEWKYVPVMESWILEDTRLKLSPMSAYPNRFRAWPSNAVFLLKSIYSPCIA
jgi:hypothetical protein